MREHSLFRRIIAGQTGAWSAPIRWCLSGCERVYTLAINRRNRAYDRGRGVCTATVPVISVGNLTVGGTGKTPVVIHILSKLTRSGFKPAVVARGYRAAYGQANDEELLIRTRVPDAAYVADPDRVRGARRAAAEYRAEVVVLDDGFQHRRLARDLDMVLIDATCPFGFDHLLPRGLLREPVAALTRADVVVITRCDQVPEHTLEHIRERVAGVRSDMPVLRSRHRVSAVEQLDGTPVGEPLQGKRAVLFAGIAQPQSFLNTVRGLGVEVVGHRWWPDHYRYRVRDIEGLRRGGGFSAHDVLITTEKDAMKLRALTGLARNGIAVVRVDIDFEEDDGTILDDLITSALESQ